MSAEDVMMRIHFTVLWLTRLFSSIFSRQSIQRKKLSKERLKLPCERIWPSRTWSLTGGAFAQVALQCQQKLNHSAALNFSTGSVCCIINQSKSLKVLLLICTEARDLHQDPEDKLEKKNQSSRAKRAIDISWLCLSAMSSMLSHNASWHM